MSNPGDSIHLTLDTDQFDETLTYTGNGAEENNYLIGKFLLEEKEMGSADDFYALEEADYIARTQALRDSHQKHFAEFVEKNPEVNKTFAENAKIDLTYGWALQRQKYEKYHGHYTDNKDFKISEEYNDFLTDLQLNDEKLIGSDSYKNFIKTYYANLAYDKMNAEESSETDENIGYLKHLFAIVADKAPAIKEYLMFNALKEQINYRSIDGIDPFLAQYKEFSTNDDHKTQLTEAYDKWAVIATGAEAPDFAYTDIKGQTVALSSLKGKNVYIDVWATWCGPCKREIPHLEELQETYKGNDNIVFASVSIDENKEAWEKMVTEKEMKGVSAHRRRSLGFQHL